MSPSTSVSLAITSLLVKSESSSTVNVSSTATGFVFNGILTKLNTLTWPESVALSSFIEAATANIVPSPETETVSPNLSSGLFPKILNPIFIQSEVGGFNSLSVTYL